MILNKHGHLDARNVLAHWSFIKWIIDLIAIAAGGGIFAYHSPTGILSLVFLLWIWTFIKFVVDTPLVLIWLWGKVKHEKRKRKKRVKKWKTHSSTKL